MPPKPPINTRKRPRQARSAATVETILEAAARILENGGLAAFNTNAVAARAGVSIGSLYQYFPGKEALLAALIRNNRQTLLDDLARLSDPAIDLALTIDRLVAAALAHQFDRPRLARSLEYAEALLPIDAETHDLNHRIAGIVAEVLIRHGVRDAATAAQDLAAMTRGMVDAAGMAGETDLPDLKRRVKRAVYGYLGLVHP